MDTLSLTWEARIYNGGKSISLKSGPGETGQSLVKEETRTLSGEGNGNPLQCSFLENPGDGGAWWAAISGVAQSQTQLKRLSSSSSNMSRLKVGSPELSLEL